MKRIENLVSTMHQQDHSLLDRLHIQTDTVVVNQCDREGREEFDYHGNRILWIDTCERGLSRSRNMALRAATAEICVITDDDMVYRDGYPQIIEKAFDETPEAALLRFEVEGIEGVFKKYSHQGGKLNLLGSMKVSSVEIAFRREAILEKGIWFDELIGAGTEFPMGEENTFLFACLRNQLQLYYVPQVIADLHIGESTWFEGYNEKNFVGRGAAFTAMDRSLSGLLALQFAVRKYKLYKKDMPFFKALRYMRKGIKLYLQKKV